MQYGWYGKGENSWAVVDCAAGNGHDRDMDGGLVVAIVCLVGDRMTAGGHLGSLHILISRFSYDTDYLNRLGLPNVDHYA